MGKASRKPHPVNPLDSEYCTEVWQAVESSGKPTLWRAGFGASAASANEPCLALPPRNGQPSVCRHGSEQTKVGVWLARVSMCPLPRHLQKANIQACFSSLARCRAVDSIHDSFVAGRPLDTLCKPFDSHPRTGKIVRCHACARGCQPAGAAGGGAG